MAQLRERAQRVLLESHLDTVDLWVRYLGNGGNVPDWDFEAYLYGAALLPDLEQMILECTLNEVAADYAGSDLSRW
jgi:hypothetical protein